MDNDYTPQGYFTFHKEGTDTTSSVIHCPGPYSGVTIGRGYDMKYKNELQIYSDLTACGMSKQDAAIVKKAAGKFGASAHKFVDENINKLSPFVKWQQIALFGKIFPVYINTVKSIYKKIPTVIHEKNIRYVNLHDSKVTWQKTDWNSLETRLIDIAVDMNYQGFYFAHTAEAMSRNSIPFFIDYILKYPGTKGFEKGRKLGRDRVGYLSGVVNYESF